MENREKKFLSIQIDKLPIAANVCQQELREVWKESTGKVSLAHVIMEPKANSLLHEHHVMTELYQGLEGKGELTVGEEVVLFQKGTVVEIPPFTPHKLTNLGEQPLIHTVLAIPAFNPQDVFILEKPQ